MADYAKIMLRGIYSANSDYSDPRVDTKTLENTLTPNAYRHDVVSCLVAGTTIELGEFTTTVDAIFIKNLDASNFVEARWTSQSTANKQKIPAGKLFFIPAATAANDLVIVADTAAVLCELFIVGTKA